MKRSTTCATCGQPVWYRLYRWKHKRPQPSGAPHDHHPQPTTTKRSNP